MAGLHYFAEAIVGTRGEIGAVDRCAGGRRNVATRLIANRATAVNSTIAENGSNFHASARLRS